MLHKAKGAQVALALAPVALVALACATTADGSPPPVVANPPRWGWDTLGDMAFFHAGDPRPYTAADLALLPRFPMVQFDKKQGEGWAGPIADASTEDRIIAGARAVKAASPAATTPKTLMYINGLIDFAESRLHAVTKADPSLLLVNTKGERVTLAQMGVYDVRNPKMRAAFVANALYGVASGVIDGVFIDRANWCEQCAARGGWDTHTCESMVPAQRLLLTELTSALGEGNITLAKEHGGTDFIDWQVVNAAMTSDAFCSSYCHGCNASATPGDHWGASDAVSCAASIATIANMSGRGQLTQSHAMGPFSGPAAAQAREFVMAAFLVGAGNLSYFSYANWITDCWSIKGTAWWPEYDRRLGRATSPPNTRLPGEKWKYTRTFSSGTTVYVDLMTRVAVIEWADDDGQ